MKRRINEEIGTSVSESVKSLIFIDLGSYLSNKGGSLVVMIPEVGAQKILKWAKFVHTNPIYQENKSHFDALTARFTGNTILNSIYSKINKVKSATVSSAEENTKREQQIARELGRAGRYIQSKLTDVEKQLFAKVSADLRNPSLFLVKSLNDKLTSTVSTPEPEEPATPEETPETPDTKATEKPAEPAPEAKPEETPAAEPKAAPATKSTEPAPTEEPAPAEPAAAKPAAKTAPKAAPAEKPAEVPAEKPAAKPAPKPAPKPAAKPAEKPAPKPAPAEKPAKEPEDDSDKQEEAIRKIKNVIREYVLQEIRKVVSEAGFDDTTDWKSLSKPLVIGGKDVGFVLPNGIKINTEANQVWVESPDLIRKVSELLMKKVIIPANYQKAYRKLSFGYNQIDEDPIGLVLFDIK